MKKTIITLVAAATIFSAVAPIVSATNLTPAEAKQRLDLFNAQKALVEKQKEVVKKADEAAKAASEDAALLAAGKDGLWKQVEAAKAMYDAATSDDKKAAFYNTYVAVFEEFQQAKEHSDTANRLKEQTAAILANEKTILANLEAELKRLGDIVNQKPTPEAAKNATTPASSTNAPAAANTATGAKTLPKTSAVK